MKKTLLITDYFRPEPGGLEGFITGVARNWKDGEIEVLVTTGKKQYLTDRVQRERFDAEEPFPIHRLDPEFKSYFLWEWNGVLRNHLQKRLATGLYERVLFGNITPHLSDISQMVRGAGIPYAIIVNGADMKNRLSSRLRKNRRFAFHANQVFALSQEIAVLLRASGLDVNRIFTLPPGMENRWDSRKWLLPENWRNRMDGKFLIAAVGPLLPRKGLDQALLMMTHLADIKEKIHLVIAGTGPEYGYLKELIRVHQLESQVDLVGFLSDEELGSLYQNAALMIQPGMTRDDDVEGMSMAVMEAAYFGLPVVAGSMGGLRNLIRDGVTGFLVEPGNVRLLADRVRRLYVFGDQRMKMSRNAKILARNEFTLSRAASMIQSRL